MTKYDLDEPLDVSQKPQYKREVIRRNGKVEVRQVKLKAKRGPSTTREHL